MSLGARGPGMSAPEGVETNLRCPGSGHSSAAALDGPRPHARLWEQHCQAAKLLPLKVSELLPAWRGLGVLFYPMSLLKMHLL